MPPGQNQRVYSTLMIPGPLHPALIGLPLVFHLQLPAYYWMLWAHRMKAWFCLWQIGVGLDICVPSFDEIMCLRACMAPIVALPLTLARSTLQSVRLRSIGTTC